MTYRELQDQLTTLSEEQLDCDVTVYDRHSDEFFPTGDDCLMIHIGISVLEDGHPYIEF